MSVSPNLAENPINTNQNTNIKKPKGRLENTDLNLREQADNYNRKNIILWVLSICLVIVIISTSIIFVKAIFTDINIQKMLLNKLAENIVVIVTVAFAIFGIQVKN